MLLTIFTNREGSTQKMTLNNKIKCLREAHGYSQESTAKYLGISQNEMTDLENSSHTLSSDIAAKLASLFGVSESSFINDDALQTVTHFDQADSFSSSELDAIAQINKIALNAHFMSSLAR